jgi:thiamine-phosphate pyrophosphorylase
MSGKKKIERLHYLTQDGAGGLSHAELAEQALAGGVKWIQFRTKKLAGNELLSEAKRVKKVAEKYGATLLINDHVLLAAELGLGVHLGKKDMPVKEARKILGNNTIIGGTANTAEDVFRLVEEGADYIGLGPYRFTTTKENLSPVLATDELARSLSVQKQVPVIVIGGIKAEDVRSILDLGAYGVAVSSAINLQPDIAGSAKEFLRTFEMEEV